jgi:L-ascorbate metabolism protein UlaG (beta-lactamase superfamily)
MIVPCQADDVFIADVRRTMQRRTGVSLWWLGQSGFLVHYDGVCIAIDPYLSDSLTIKYANTAKPHVRMTARVVDPTRLDMVSLVTSSHNHTDHLDAETIGSLWQTNPRLQVACSAANVSFAAERLQVAHTQLKGLVRGVPWQHGPFTLHVVPAAHNVRECDDAGHERFIGLVIEVGDVVIYHSGDTLHYDGMESLLRQWCIDVALLPINGNDPARGVAGNLDGGAAAALAHAIGAHVVVPCHYNMFEFNTADPAHFCAQATALRQQYRLLQAGERLDSAPE